MNYTRQSAPSRVNNDAPAKCISGCRRTTLSKANRVNLICRFLAVFLPACLWITLSAGADADVVIYDVNLQSSPDPTTGFVLSVVGTITGDTTKTDASAIISSSLIVEHPTDADTALPSLPNAGAFNVANMRWNLSPTEIRFERLTSDISFISWQEIFTPSPDLATFSLGTGSNAHVITRSDIDLMLSLIHI